ncbi:cytochrome c biogenesis protein CcsA [Aestuariirhabdus sp. LZHN29]|uniref:cytochrome c biogenesis protein CcsA n=1 Tax=Aestuariirhabdus sp. LZHN29 TaxID=3417462 RepID=UPI003CF63E62
MLLETWILWGCVLIYVAAGCLAIISTVFRKRPDRTLLLLILGGLAMHSVAIGLRWERLGHGPFNTMFEILSSNIWSLTLFFSIVYWRIAAIRPIAAFVLPVIFMMMGWMMSVPDHDSILPASYLTPWLYVHVGFGKVFMGALLVSFALSLVVLLREGAFIAPDFARLPGNASLDELSYRFILLALVFDSLMLVAGAIWAQDAWGRFWSWDPLETWAFVSWLLLAFTLHFRVTYRPQPMYSAMLAILVFAISFMTFFGIPFINQVPHQGAV